MKILVTITWLTFSTIMFAQARSLPSLKNQNNNYFSNNDSQELIFSIYPTPLLNGRLEIKSNSSSLKHIQIYNILGEVVFETSTYVNKLELFSLDTGIYMFRLTQDDRSGIKRLVVP